MNGTMALIPLLLLASVAVLIGATIRVIRHERWKSMNRWGLVLATLPSVLMVGSFYSLAVHMHRSLGGWPERIGSAGFPPALLTHDDIASWYFAIAFPLAVLALPLAILACSLVPRWRRGVVYLVVAGWAFVACFAVMLAAPAEFLYWWWD
jgi:hypothetical protein